MVRKVFVLVVLLLFALVMVLGACAPAGIGQGRAADSEETSTTEQTPGDAADEPSGDAADTPSPDVADLPRLVDNAAWVTRDGETALVVSPSQLLRDSGSTAVFDEAWRRVVVAIPEADTPGMRDQFVCHAVFAPTKNAWYLEPARPAVGFARTVTAGCNPGDVRDVG